MAALVVWCFETRLLDLMGFLPEPESAGLDPLAAGVIRQFLTDDPPDVLAPAAANRINTFLQREVALNTGGTVPPARRLALETQV